MCEPPALAPQDSPGVTNYYHGEYKTSLQSCALNIKGDYLTIGKEYIDTGDYSIRIDMAPKCKNAVINALTCPLQFTSTITSNNGCWVSLGRLQTKIRSFHMKMEILFSEGDVSTGSTIPQDSMYNRYVNSSFCNKSCDEFLTTFF